MTDEPSKLDDLIETTEAYLREGWSVYASSDLSVLLDALKAARSCIAALEAVIMSVGDALPRSLNTPLVRTLRALLVAPSVVLDGMIREAKAEGRKEALREADCALSVLLAEPHIYTTAAVVGAIQAQATVRALVEGAE